jgi:hypothetical protein
VTSTTARGAFSAITVSPGGHHPKGHPPPRDQPSLASRSMQSAADAHGEVKVNCWEKPTQISEWKEEHIVIAVLAAWGVTITSAMKIFGGGNKEEAAVAEGK